MNEMERKNPFCVVSKETYGEHHQHDIQTNDAWMENPYGDEYAVVPDEMVPAMMETDGYCDITYTADGKTVKSFVARAKPEPKPDEPEEPGEVIPSVWDELDAAYQEGVDSI